MDRAWQIITDYQWWLYGFLALLLLFYLRRAILARRENARSIFKLEQEQARTRYGRSVTVMAIILVVMAAVLGLSNYLIPSLNRPPEPTLTATTGPLAAPTLTATPLPATMTPTATATQVPPTKPVQAIATPPPPVSPTPVVRPASCPNPHIQITYPGVNQVLQGLVVIRGTANPENFDYYKVEIASGANPQDDSWRVIGDLQRTPVVNGVLETLNSEALLPGVYTLQLRVVDKSGNFRDACRVTVTVQR